MYQQGYPDPNDPQSAVQQQLRSQFAYHPPGTTYSQAPTPSWQTYPAPNTTPPPPVPPPPSAPSAVPQQSVSDPRNWFAGFQGRYAPTQQGIRDLGNDAEFQAAGWRLGNPNASGVIDSVIGPQGQTIDVIKGAMSGNGSWQWGAWGPSAGSWAAPGESAGPVGPAPAAAAASAGNGGSAFTSKIRELLLAQLQGLSKPVSGDDAAIAEPMAAARLEAQRANDFNRKAIAERLYASGDLGGDELTQRIQQSNERMGSQLAGVKGQLFANEIQARRGQMQQLLNMALASGDAESARELQMALAQMDNQFRYAGLGEQARQFGASLGEQRRQFDDQFGRQLARDYADDQRFWYGGF